MIVDLLSVGNFESFALPHPKEYPSVHVPGAIVKSIGLL